MARISRAQQIALPLLDDKQPRRETSFRSRGFAVPATRPQDDFGLDPFATFDNAPFPLMIGDFIKA